MSTQGWLKGWLRQTPSRNVQAVIFLWIFLVIGIGCMCTGTAAVPTPTALTDTLSPTITQTNTPSPTRPTEVPTITLTPGRLTRIALTQASYDTQPPPVLGPSEVPSGTTPPGGATRTRTATLRVNLPTRTNTYRPFYPSSTPRPTYTPYPTLNYSATATRWTATAAQRQTLTKAAQQTATSLVLTVTSTAKTREAFFTEVAQTATALVSTQTSIALTSTAQAQRPDLIVYSADINSDGLLDLLATINTQTGGTIEIRRASDANMLVCDWSPEGAWVLYERYPEGGTHRLYRALSNGQGSEQALQSQPDGMNIQGSWSPDGQWVAFRNEQGGTVRLYALRPIDGTLVPLTSGRDVAYPDWSADGRTLIFVGNEGGTLSFYTLDVAVLPRSNPATTPTPTPVPFPVTAPGMPANISWPHYSPDGSRLVFVAGGDLWLLRLGQVQSDTNPANLTHSGDANMPSWSRDGTKIVFLKGGELNVIDPSTDPASPPVPIPNASGSGKQRPNWLP